MSQEIINTGALPNDGDGDPLRTAFTKINNNFTELYGISSAEGPNGAIQYNLVTTGSGATGNTALTGNVVTTLNIITAGSGYKPVNPPAIVITPASGDTTGTGAAAYAVVTGDAVSNVVITSGGSNYTLPPVVQFLSTTDNELKGSPNLTYNPVTGNVNLGANLIPSADNAISIGSSANKVGNLFVGQQSLRVGNLQVYESGNTLAFTVSANSQVKGSLTVQTTTANTTVTGSTSTTTAGAVSFRTMNNANNQVIFQTPISTFTTGKFDISSYEEFSQNMQSITINATRTADSTGVKFIATGTMVESNIVVGEYDMDVLAGNVRILVSPEPDGNVTHKIAYQINN
jgi:hypothetical protein